MALKANDIKKRVIGGHNTKYGPARLYVNEHDGEMWATNRYWVTRAERVAPLLDQYNLSAAEPGVYEVNGTVRRANGDNKGIPAQPPNVGRVIEDAGSFTPGVPVRIAGNQAYTRGDRGGLYAVYLLNDGTHAGLGAEELEWLSDTATAPTLPEPHVADHVHYGDVRVSFSKNAHGVPCALVRAEVVRVIKRPVYEGSEVTPAVTEPGEPVVLGMMMGMSYGA